MKTASITDIIRQGDVLLVPCPQPPADAAASDASGIHIAGERTGHAHELPGAVATLDGRTYVRGGDVLRHQEHEHVQTAPTWYEVRVQREYTNSAIVRRWD